MRLFTIGILAILCSLPAVASTPAAWSKLERDAKRSCLAASDFKRPRTSEIVVFNDSVGQVAMLVTGIYRQAHMKGARGTNLCLYNPRNGSAAAEEALGWGVLRSGNVTPRN